MRYLDIYLVVMSRQAHEKLPHITHAHTQRPLGKGIDVYHSTLLIYITSLASLVPLTLHLLSPHPNSSPLFKKFNIACFGLTVKCSPQAHMFEHLAPSQ